MKYMIHATPTRMWYVDEFLIPSMLSQGIDRDEIQVWLDDKHRGNLESCMAAFASCEGGATWHLQDDVLICRDFAKRTRELDNGVVFGFCCEPFEDDPTITGNVYIPDMWHSFQCVRIPDEIAQECAEWYRTGQWEDVQELVILRLHNLGDDTFFREFMMDRHGRETAYNAAPNLVEHVDRIIGGSVINQWRGWWARSSLWEDEDLIEELSSRIKNRRDPRLIGGKQYDP